MSLQNRTVGFFSQCKLYQAHRKRKKFFSNCPCSKPSLSCRLIFYMYCIMGSNTKKCWTPVWFVWFLTQQVLIFSRCPPAPVLGCSHSSAPPSPHKALPWEGQDKCPHFGIFQLLPSRKSTTVQTVLPGRSTPVGPRRMGARRPGPMLL